MGDFNKKYETAVNSPEFENPEALLPMSIAKELSNKDLKLVIKELHNISQELKTLNTILRRMN